MSTKTHKVNATTRTKSKKEIVIDPKSILGLLKELCRVPSVSTHVEQENDIAKMIFQIFLTYAAKHGHTIEGSLFPCEGDRYGRDAVWVLLKTAHTTDRTVLLTGHFDVVDTNGHLDKIAFDPDQYTKRLAKEPLNAEAKADLKSGNWLFGRGTMDMKAGLSIFINAIYALSQSPDLGVNIAFLAVPDEENDSAGMRGALRFMTKKLEENHLKLVAALTGEPCFWTSGKHPVRPYYTGTTGKIMPYFLCVGRASHVNDYAQGVNSTLLLSEVIRAMEGMPELIDGEGSDTLAPPTCLKAEARVKTYSVSLPERSICYFNVLTVSKTPADVLEILLRVAHDASKKAMNTVDTIRKNLLARGADVPAETPAWSIYTMAQMTEAARKRLGKTAFEREKKRFFASRTPQSDARETAIEFSEWILSVSGLKGPLIVVGFLPPYYPHRLNHRASEDEIRLDAIVRETVKRGGELSGDGLTAFTNVFGGISDLSFLGFEGSREALETLRDNMPGWGNVYDLPIDTLLKLNVPVANMGPAGKDAHQMTERLELDYSLRVAPTLLLEAIEKLT